MQVPPKSAKPRCAPLACSKAGASCAKASVCVAAYTKDHMVYVDGDGAPIEAVTTVRGG